MSDSMTQPPTTVHSELVSRQFKLQEKISDNAAGKVYQISKGKSVFLLVVLTLLYMLAYMDRSIMIVIVEPMKADLGLTDAQIGFLHSVFFVGVAILTIPCGIMVDRWSRRKFFALTATIWSVATFATGMASHFYSLLIVRFLTGSGEAGFAPGGTAWLSLTFSEKSRSRVFGIFNMGIPIGSMLGIILGGMITTKTGDWRNAFYIFAIPGIILGIISFFLTDYETVKPKTNVDIKWSKVKDIVGILKIKSYVIACLGFASWSFVLFGINSWMTALLMREYGVTTENAGFITGVLILMGAVGAPLGGFLSDKFQQNYPRGRYLFVGLAILVATITKFILFQTIGKPLELVIVIGIIDGICFMMAPPAFFSITQDVVKPSLRATSFAISISIMFLLGGAWGPVIIGKLSDVLGSDANALKLAMSLTLPFGLLAAVLFFWGSKYYPKDCEGISNQVMSEK